MSAFAQLTARRAAGEILILDGAMGTELEARGLPMDDEAWCALANLDRPELVREIHRDHIRAGADVITTNTFMSGRGPMERAGVGDRFAGGLRAAVRVAQEAIADTAQRPVAIAGSISATPWGSPVADADPAALRRLREDNLRQVEILAEAGAEVIALEMVRDRRLAEPAIEAALACGLPVWLGLTMRSAPTPYETLPTIEEAAELARSLITPELDAVNVMHTDIADVADGLGMVRGLWAGATGAYPHHGRWERPHWTYLAIPVEQLTAPAAEWLALGATILGGCCGLGAEHTAALRALADARRTMLGLADGR